MGAQVNRFCAIQSVDGHVGGEPGNPTTKMFKIAPDSRHVSILQVRRNWVRAWLDGQLMAEIDPTRYALSLQHPKYKHWDLNDESRLALGTFASPTEFHAIQVVEVSGKGTFTRTPPTAPPAGAQDMTQGDVVTIPGNAAVGYEIGALKKGATVTLQFVSGQFKEHGTWETDSPETVGRHDNVALVIAEKGAGEQLGEVLAMVPGGT